MIVLEERELKGRPKLIGDLLRPLRPNRRIAGQFAKSLGSSQQRVLGGHDGTPPDGHPRTWYFRTAVPGVSGQYWETWLNVKSQRYVLEEVFFHIVEFDGSRTPHDLMAVHIEPREANQFKRGPHLHVTCAPSPTGHIHFPLQLRRAEAYFLRETRFRSLLWAVMQMVSVEVLPKYADDHR